MTTSNSGYGAIPSIHNAIPGGIGAQGASGQILTSNGMNGTSWMSQGINIAQPSAMQIGNNPDPVLTIHYDGTITTKAGSITTEDWISVIKVMKQIIMDMSKDQELVSKYPYIQDAAHTWFMNELKGRDNGKTKDE
jgi:hypothetical protein